jgi:hypothetical protein
MGEEIRKENEREGKRDVETLIHRGQDTCSTLVWREKGSYK